MAVLSCNGYTLTALASQLAFEDCSQAAVAALTGLHTGISLHLRDVPPEITQAFRAAEQVW